MHIAIDARIINSSTGRYVERLLYYLQEIDTTNTYSVLIREKDRNFWRPRSSNFSIMLADFDNYSFAEQTAYKRLLDELKPDLVHFCMPQQPVFYKGKHVTTIHDLTLLKTYNSDKNWLKYRAKQMVGRYVFRRVGQTSAHIITPSNFTKNEYAEYARIPADKVTVTYEAADTVSGPKEPYDHPFGQFLLYVGQQSDYKNIKRLGEAHQQLLPARPKLGLILAGKKNAAAINNEAYFTRSGFKNILFTDFVPEPQLAWLYTHCTAYVFPSLMEGFGLPGLEAMSYGAPVISSSATCLSEIYGNAAYYFDPRSAEDMALAIKTVLDNPALGQSMIDRGAEQVKRYSWRRMAEETHAIYMKVLR